MEVFTKENLMRELNQNGSFTFSYRLLFNDAPTWVSMKAMKMTEENSHHIVIGVNSIDNQMKHQEEFENVRKRSVSYSRIAQALSRDYYSIYLVNIDNDEFVEYTSNAEYQELHVERNGDNFFETCRKNVGRLVHPDDLKKALMVWEKESLLQELAHGTTFSITYRLMFDETPVYINCKVISMDGEELGNYIVIGISNVDAQIKREQQYNEDLRKAKRAAMLDTLTGVKSKLAFTETEKEMDAQILKGQCDDFAVAVFDVNGLKSVNDTLGHKAGDEFIKAGCEVICHTFKHSPVFRIGGDEFVAVLRGTDYRNRAALAERFLGQNLERRASGGVVIACGIADWNGNEGERFSRVFEQADAEMFLNKKMLKDAK